MDNIKLDSRLSTVASLVRKDKILLDVGTDHAYLPVYCIQQGIIGEAVCCDINEGPLLNAKETIKNAGLEEKIETILSDGLKKIEPDCAEDIAIAGMGGILIAEILSYASWIKKENMHLILQPMTHAEDTRKFLCENGFEIDKEVTCSDSKHVYVVISASYTGKNSFHENGWFYYGTLGNDSSADTSAYLRRIYTSLKKKRDAMSGAGQNPEEVEYLSQVISDFENNTVIDYGNC